MGSATSVKIAFGQSHHAESRTESIDPQYFSGGLPESTENTKKTWWSRWKNCKQEAQMDYAFVY